MNRKKIIARILLADFLAENPTDFKQEITMLYELEYKRNFLKSQPKLLSLIDAKSKTIGIGIANKLKAVYQEWLQSHALKDPKQWAESTFKVGEKKIKNVESDYEHWAKGKKFWVAENFSDLSVLPEFSKWLDALYKGFPEKALKYLMRFSFMGAMSLLKKYKEISSDKIALEFYEHIVFPEWLKYWKKQGLEKTYNRIEKVYEELKKLPMQHPPKLYTTINKALHESHQSGDMMEYIQMGFGVSKEDLDSLSNTEVKKWDKEIKDLIPNDNEQ